MENLKTKFKSLVYSLAMQESASSGKDYTECINEACEESCIRLEADCKEFIRMFL